MSNINVDIDAIFTARAVRKGCAYVPLISLTELQCVESVVPPRTLAVANEKCTVAHTLSAIWNSPLSRLRVSVTEGRVRLEGCGLVNYDAAL